MARKYTIFKVLTRNLNKGFTLLELLVGLVIMSIVGVLAMNAFLEASSSFNQDKRNIDNNQNLSAILEIIGNDIRQAGEGITESNFPSIEFDTATASDVSDGLQSGSSKIVIRKAVRPQLTLCNSSPIPSGGAIPTTINVADTASANANCTFTAGAPTLFPSNGVTIAPFNTLIDIRQYRCQLDLLNSDYASETSDLCTTASATGREVLRAAISDGNGRIRTFNYYDDNFNAITSPNTYSITTAMTTGDPTNIPRNTTVPYPVGSPIYLIEERVYALDNTGNLTLAINGGNRQTLIKKIAQFKISARLYTNALDREVNPTPAPATVIAPATTISATDLVCPIVTGGDQPTAAAATTTNPQYICQFNYNTLASDVPMNWKTLAGVKISLQAKYDGTGRASESSTNARDIEQVKNDKLKLKAEAEYFPRNVLSR